MQKNLLKFIAANTIRKFAATTAICASSLTLFAQGNISGKVTDEAGEPLPGASISVKGSTQGVMSDTDGGFTINNAPSGATLVVTYIGYVKQEVSVGSKTFIEIVLKEDAQALDEVVVVGYGSQKKVNLTGAISTVQSKELTVTPVASVSNMFAGRLSGLVATQSSGLPGEDGASLSIRGFGDALVIVDGVDVSADSQTSFNKLDANQIESVNILKDAAAAIYGARAGNGVILITTKRGQEGKPTINFNAAQTWQSITIFPDMLSAGQYAELESEHWLHQGGDPSQAPYSPEQIRKYYEGTDPMYPNTDWWSELVRDWAPQQKYNVSVRGGSDKIRYYGLLGYMRQETMWKNDGGDYQRYNFQANIDAKILYNLSMEMNISGMKDASDFASGMTGWHTLWTTYAIYPAHYPDPDKVPYAFGAGNGGAHITTNRKYGYKRTDIYNFNGTVALKYDFKFVKGLSAKYFANYLQYFDGNKTFSKPVTTYTYDYGSNIYTVASQVGGLGKISEKSQKGTTVTQQLSLSYERTFNNAHHINALALFEGIETFNSWVSGARTGMLSTAVEQLNTANTDQQESDGNGSEMGRASYIGRLNYDYKGKYLAEIIFRADASARFAPSQRQGYFPGFSMGWRLSEENFLKKDWLDNLKIRASYGQMGYDKVADYRYLAGYKIEASSVMFGSGAEKGIVTTGLANELFTWEKMTIYNAGFDFSFLKRKIYGEFDVFYRLREGIIATRKESYPSTFGVSLPEENLNSQDNRGFELSLGTVGKIDDFTYDVKGNISWSRAKWVKYDEPEYTDPDQIRLNKKTGNWTDRQIGYLTNGLFTSKEQIDQLPYTIVAGNNGIGPGDVWYRDLNDDKIIDWKDQVVLGSGTDPHWMAGVNLDLAYKNFDLSALFQSSFGYYKQVPAEADPKVSNRVSFESRWTEENNDPNALTPRYGGSSTNYWFSDRVYKQAGYLRLKVFSLGYSLPKSWMRAANMQNARIYVSGTNLLTFDRLKKYKIDPEAPSGTNMSGRYYPQQRTVTVGINVSF